MRAYRQRGQTVEFQNLDSEGNWSFTYFYINTKQQIPEYVLNMYNRNDEGKVLELIEQRTK